MSGRDPQVNSVGLVLAVGVACLVIATSIAAQWRHRRDVEAVEFALAEVAETRQAIAEMTAARAVTDRAINAALAAAAASCGSPAK